MYSKHRSYFRSRRSFLQHFINLIPVNVCPRTAFFLSSSSVSVRQNLPCVINSHYYIHRSLFPLEVINHLIH